MGSMSDGIKHDRVRSVLIREIENLWGSETEVHIITGYSIKMKAIVIRVLNEYKLDYKIGDFAGINMGFIKTEI